MLARCLLVQNRGFLEVWWHWYLKLGFRVWNCCDGFFGKFKPRLKHIPFSSFLAIFWKYRYLKLKYAKKIDKKWKKSWSIYIKPIFWLITNTQKSDIVTWSVTIDFEHSDREISVLPWNREDCGSYFRLFRRNGLKSTR